MLARPVTRADGVGVLRLVAQVPRQAVVTGEIMQLIISGVGRAQSSVQPSTVKAYEPLQQRFAAFCQQQLGLAHPHLAPAAAVIAFLEHLIQVHASQGNGPEPIKKARAALHRMYTFAGVSPSPTDHPIVGHLIEAACRQLHTATPLVREPMQPSHVRGMLDTHILQPLRSGQRPCLQDAQHVVVFALAFSALLRYSDMAAVLVHRSSMRFQPLPNPTAVDLHLWRSKTDPRARGCSVTVPAVGGDYCPVRLLRWLLDFGGYVTDRDDVDCGPLLRPVRSGQLAQRTAPLDQPIAPTSDRLLRAELQVLLTAAGVPAAEAARYNLHSFRSGAATLAAAAGVSEEGAMAAGRWRSSSSHARYVRGPVKAAVDACATIAGSLG